MHHVYVYIHLYVCVCVRACVCVCVCMASNNLQLCHKIQPANLNTTKKLLTENIPIGFIFFSSPDDVFVEYSPSVTVHASGLRKAGLLQE